MSALLSQLMRFVSNSKPWHATPFSLKVQRTTWSVGTDSQVLLAVKLAGASPRKDYPKELVEMLAADPVDPVEINTEALQTWAGEPPSSLVPAGDVAFEHQGVLLGQSIDRRKLAHLFVRMPGPSVRAWLYSPGLLAFEHLQGHWRAFLAGLDSKPEPEEPVFQVDSKPQSLSELMQEAEAK
jgi:hypothetical protein